MKKFFSTYRYEIIAALSGAVVMMLELIGARMVAPYFGTSIYVWTAMIGVILGSLSVGYWFGGKLADNAASDRGLAAILSIASLFIGASILIQEPLLSTVAASATDVRFQAVVAAFFLFAPASCLLGIVSPYVVKLKLSSLKTAGASVGQLYAAGTAGSIAGTFATGYWLISWFGNYTLGLFLVILLLGVSFIAHRSAWRWRRLVVVAAATLSLLTPQALAIGIIADVDSAYSRYRVLEYNRDDGSTLRMLLTDNMGAQSGYIVGAPDQLVFEYTRGFKIAADAYGPMDSSLMIGGGAYTFPGLIARQQPKAAVDVVEIDPSLDDIAAKYFGYQPQENLRLVHQDGRVFLNQNKKTYDTAFLDAYSSLSPPFQLSTVEAAQAVKRAVKQDGLVVANVIAGITSDDPYYAATYRTYDQVFDAVKVYRVQPRVALDHRQNLVFVMGSQKTIDRVAGGMKELVEATAPDQGRLLTDDHAPVDQLINAGGS